MLLVKGLTTDKEEPPRQDAFGLVVIEKPAPSVDGKCDKVRVKLEVNDAPRDTQGTDHDRNLKEEQPLLASPPR